MLQHSHYTENIFAVYQATWQLERARYQDWYAEAYNIACQISQETNKPLTQVIGVLAALSPRCKWEKNLEDTYIACTLGTDSITGQLGNNIHKADRILQGEHPKEVLRGNKVIAFYHNILSKGQDTDYVTVDTWAIRIAHNNPNHDGKISNREYARIAEAYKEVAGYAHLTPAQLQAITWASYRSNGQPNLM